MSKMPTNWLGKSSELKLHCFCLFDAYSMPKYMCSEVPVQLLLELEPNWLVKNVIEQECRWNDAM